MKGYVRKRGDAWQLAIYVGLDDRKRRQYIYETVTGTRRDAERRLAVLVVEVDGGRRGAPGASHDRVAGRDLVGDGRAGTLSDDPEGLPATARRVDPSGAWDNSCLAF